MRPLTFDAHLRRSTLSLFNSSTPLASSTFSYDTASRLASVSHGYAYDDASRLFAVSDGTNSATYRYLTGSGIVSEIAYTNSGALRMINTRQFDGLYRLTNTASVGTGSTPFVISFGYQYNSANQRTRTTREDGSYWVYQYDSLGQVTSGKKYWSDGTPVAGQQFEYGFDDIGNRETAGSGGDQFGANLRVENYSVNSLNQYTQRTVPGKVDILGAARTNGTVTVNYQSAYRKGEYFRAELSADNAGGPVWLSVTNIGALKDGANPDIVSTNTGNVLLAKAVEAFTHDADGNLTSDSLWTNIWNGENRLVAVESASGVPVNAKRKVEFVYDERGRRIQKIVSTNNGSAYVAVQTNKFFYDGWNLVAELNGPNNAVIRSYMWGSDLSGSLQGAGGVGGLLAVTIATNGVHFTAYDGNGNVSALVGASSGTATANYEYSPFGVLLRAEGVVAKVNPFRFSTKFQDDETDQLYYGYRYLSTSTGRWISRDPIEEKGGKNLYRFAGNDAVNAIDRLGLAVGKITINISQPDRSWWHVGWLMYMDWRPPSEWKPTSCPPCERAVWVQRYWYMLTKRHLWETETVQGWTKDWDENDNYDGATPWILGKGSPNDRAVLTDTPQIYGQTKFIATRMTFQAESCVKCVKGVDSGKIYGCVTWDYTYDQNSNPDLVGGVLWFTDSPRD